LEKNKNIITNESSTVVKKRSFRRWMRHVLKLKGGANIEIAKIVVKIVTAKEWVIGLTGGGVVILSKNINSAVIINSMHQSLTQNLPDYRKNKYILVGGEKLYEDSLEYLFLVLTDQTILYEEKEKVASTVLNKYLNLKKWNERLHCLICIISILYILSSHYPSSFYILMTKLIKAIKKGKISKLVGRAIIRKLRRKGVPIDPNLIEVVNG